jgi:hypothetical protein
MNIKKYVTGFAQTFAIVFVVSAIVSFLYSLVVHGESLVDWGSTFRLAIVLGIVLPWLQLREKNLPRAS